MVTKLPKIVPQEILTTNPKEKNNEAAKRYRT
jgi:hypothetical protein